MKLPFKSLFLTLLMGTSALLASADDDTSKNYEAFIDAFKKGDIGKVEKILNKWEKKTPNDPELYCSWAQFYYFQAINLIEQSEDMADFEHTAMFPDTIAMFQDLKCKNFRIMKDKGNGLEMFNKAVVWQQRCMDEYPDLLSMYDNYMDVLNTKKEYKYSTKVAFQLIDRALKNNGIWVDYNLKPYDEQLRQEIEGMLVRYFDKQIQALMEGAEYELAQRLIERLEKAFPDNASYAVQEVCLYANTFQMEKAAEKSDSLVQVMSDNLDIIYINAQIHDRLGNRDKVLAAAAKLKAFKQMDEVVKYAESLEEKYATTIVVNGKPYDRTWQMKYIELMKNAENDSLAVENHLAAWEAAVPDDPELDFCYAHYYEHLAEMETRSKNSEELRAMLGSMGKQVEVKTKKWGPDGPTCDPFYRKALARLQKTLAVNPDRIDYIAQLMQDAYNLTVEDSLIYQTATDALTRSVAPGHQWLTSFNKTIDHTQQEMADVVIDLAAKHLYNMGSFGYLLELNEHYKELYPEGTAFDKWQKKLESLEKGEDPDGLFMPGPKK